MAVNADDNAFTNDFFEGYPTEDSDLQKVRQLVLHRIDP